MKVAGRLTIPLFILGGVVAAVVLAAGGYLRGGAAEASPTTGGGLLAQALADYDSQDVPATMPTATPTPTFPATATPAPMADPISPAGTISGRVIDAGDSPIQAAELWACPFAAPGVCGSTWTTADGLYTIGGLGTGDYRVGACATGYLCEYYDDHLTYGDADPVPVTEGADTPNIDFGLRDEGTISGTVTDGGGALIPGARVSAGADSGPGSYGYATTGSDGTYTVGGLATGDYSVQACATGYLCEYYDNHADSEDADPVAVTEGADTPNIDFSLRDEGTISGTVTDGGGSPIGGAWVIAHADAYDSGAGWWMATSQADGSYVVTGLASGSYYVAASPALFTEPPYVLELYDGVRWPDEATVVDVVEGSDTPDIHFSLEVAATISGEVEDSLGNPIEGATVRANPVDHQVPWWWGYFPESAGPHGSYTIPGLPTGSYIVWAEADLHVTEYWDNVPAYDDATPVAVVEGSDTPNIDFSLDPDRCTPPFTDLGLASPDTDCDGAPDIDEDGPDPFLCGSRDPLDPWDFYDVPAPSLFSGGSMNNRDSAVTILNDVLGVLEYTGTQDGGPPNSGGRDYDDDIDGDGHDDGLAYDRSVGAPWSGPPDGAINIVTDVLLALAQSGIGPCPSA